MKRGAGKSLAGRLLGYHFFSRVGKIHDTCESHGTRIALTTLRYAHYTALHCMCSEIPPAGRVEAKVSVRALRLDLRVYFCFHVAKDAQAGAYIAESCYIVQTGQFIKISLEFAGETRSRKLQTCSQCSPRGPLKSNRPLLAHKKTGGQSSVTVLVDLTGYVAGLATSSRSMAWWRAEKCLWWAHGHGWWAARRGTEIVQPRPYYARVPDLLEGQC